MADLYKGIRGTVVKSTDATGFASLDGLTSGQFLIITSFSVTRNQVTQYVKTLDDKVFGYAWGEGVGQIQVGGIIFIADCETPNSSGFSQVDGFYSSKNVYKSSGPITLSIGDKTFLGYLENMTISAEMNEFNFGQFSLTFSIIKSGQ